MPAGAFDGHRRMRPSEADGAPRAADFEFPSRYPPTRDARSPRAAWWCDGRRSNQQLLHCDSFFDGGGLPRTYADAPPGPTCRFELAHSLAAFDLLPV
jgi:hypothetical protein